MYVEAGTLGKTQQLGSKPHHSQIQGESLISNLQLMIKIERDGV